MKLVQDKKKSVSQWDHCSEGGTGKIGTSYYGLDTKVVGIS